MWLHSATRRASSTWASRQLHQQLQEAALVLLQVGQMPHRASSSRSSHLIRFLTKAGAYSPPAPSLQGTPSLPSNPLPLLLQTPSQPLPATAVPAQSPSAPTPPHHIAPQPAAQQPPKSMHPSKMRVTGSRCGRFVPSRAGGGFPSSPPGCCAAPQWTPVTRLNALHSPQCLTR